MWKSLRVQLALAIGLAVWLLIALLALVLGWQAAEASQHEQTRLLQTLARSASLLLAEGKDERLREVSALAEARSAQSLDDWGPTLKRMQAGRPQYSWIGLVRTDGRVVTATGGLLQGASVGQREWFQNALKVPFVGDVHPAKLLATLLPAPASGEPLRFLDFAAPVRDLEGEVQAVLGAHLTWEWAREMAQHLHGGTVREAGIQLFIIDRHGHAILSPAGVDQALSVPYVAPETGAGAVRVWGDGQSYISAAAEVLPHLPAARLGWTVVARQPVAEATAAARHARTAALSVAAAGALLAAAMAWLLAGRLSQPLARIAAAAQALRAGQLDTRIPRLADTRELAELSQTLRGMTDALLQREAELAQANQGLEQRVQARTAELLQAQQQLEAANAELQALARRDGLTGLHNRRGADERLAHEFARHRRSGKPLAAAVIDIDHFKAVNDTHGHGVGDEVLRAVAQGLAAQVRQSDLVARQGGEEFLLLMPETDLQGALTLCEKLRAMVAGLRVPLPAPGQTLTVTVSLGVAVLDGSSTDAATLVEAADQALYAAKQAGRNRVHGAAAP